MTSYVAMLRGLNVGGHGRVKMDALREVLRLPGLVNISTYIQSGNVLFDSDTEDVDELASEIEKRIADELAIPTTAILRTGTEMASILGGNPFLSSRRTQVEIDKLHVTFLTARDSCSQSRVRELPLPGTDEFEIIDREVFLYCRAGYGRTRLTNDLWERRFGVAATTRNWKTVVALAELAGSSC